MRLATVEEAKRIDRVSQSRFGLSGEILMEAAGSLSAREIEQSFIPELSRNKSIAVVCGPGNNGADGLVVARHLAARFARQERVIIFLVAPEESRSELFFLQLERCRKIGIPTIDLIENPQETSRILGAALIVDAIFGIGISRPVEEPFFSVIEVLNQKAGPLVVSLDTPSGLDCDRGFPCGAPQQKTIAVKANLTITFGIAKPGFFISSGPTHVGRLRVLPIGFPLETQKSEARSTFAFGERQALRSLPKWRAMSHKADHGHALLFAGSPGMYGAGILAASSAYRVGAGYVTLASHTEPIDVLKEHPEILTAIADDERLWTHRRWTSVGIGPGLGASEKTKTLLEKLIATVHSRVVVDADAITVLANAKLFNLPSNWIVTPHAGELARILGISSEEIDSDRIFHAREAARKLGCHVLLKGFRTVVTDPSGERATIILSGNSALGKAGTGDVLTGMITGLLAQGLNPFAAAATGAYIHGRMADEWVRAGQAKSSLEASDLREILPALISRLRPIGVTEP